MTAYAQRRAAFTEKIGDAVAVIPAAIHHLRNNDTEYEYRQNSTFYYLTGFNEPEAVLVLAPNHKEHTTVLFVRPRDRTKEIWTGRRAGIEGAVATYGAEIAYPIEELEKRLAGYFLGVPHLYYGVGADERFDRIVFEAMKEARYHARRGGTTPDDIVDPGAIINEMRLFKEAAEVELMRRAGQISRFGHVAGMRATAPGAWEYEIEAALEYSYKKQGAQATAYSSIVARGDNATILHYNTNRDQLRDGDLLLVDSAAEFDMYAADITRTWPVNGRFSPEQRAIYEIVLAAQKAGIEEVRPGRTVRTYHDKSVEVITDGLIELKLIKASRAEAIEKNLFFEFYPHNTGHYIGLDVHDVGHYKRRDGSWRDMQPGMVVTVEPGIYVQRDLNVDERFKGIGVRIEDDVLCTTGAPDILTAGTPKEIAEVESLVGADVLARA